MPAQSPPEPVESIDSIEPIDHAHTADHAGTKAPAQAPTPAPARWWHRAYYAAQEHLRHQILRRVEKMSAPAQFRWRNRIFTWWPSLFSQSLLFISWQKACAYFVTQRPKEHQLIDLDALSLQDGPSSIKPPRIAIHAHLFYADMATLLAKYIEQLPHHIDLFISNPNDADQAFLYEQFCLLPNIDRLQVRLTPNRGRDIAPFVDTFGPVLLEYDFIAHLHSKKSLGTNSIGGAWCHYLWDQLLNPINGRITKIFTLLQNHSLVYPQKFQDIDVQNLRWGDHLLASRTLSALLDIAPPKGNLTSEDFVEFPVGSMFWARADALAPLLEAKLQYHQFDVEEGQTDHTLHHTIERNLTRIALSSGKPIAVLKNTAYENTYP